MSTNQIRANSVLPALREDIELHTADGLTLVGELATCSDEFRVRWGGHDVRYYRSGTQPFRHPLVGDLTLEYDALEIPADPGQTIVAYSAPAGSAAREALGQLVSEVAADGSASSPSMPDY